MLISHRLLPSVRLVFDQAQDSTSSAPSSRTLIEWSAAVLAAVLLIFADRRFSRRRSSLLNSPSPSSPMLWAGELLLSLSLLAKSVWLGGKFGINRDRVSNSFIKAHNLVVRSHARELSVDTRLFSSFFPDAWRRMTKQQVIERANGRAVQIVTAAGGARRGQKGDQESIRPSLILAVACERDLISGITGCGGERYPSSPCRTEGPKVLAKTHGYTSTPSTKRLKFHQRQSEGKAAVQPLRYDYYAFLAGPLYGPHGLFLLGTSSRDAKEVPLRADARADPSVQPLLRGLRQDQGSLREGTALPT